jgi:uroporphyrinogen-III synthase
VVNTRAIHQAGELDDLLRDRGAIPLAYPSIAIEPPADSTELDAALANLCAGQFEWLALTSANTVHALAERTGRLPSAPTVRVAVVGPGTAEAALRELGLRADVMPATYRAVDLAVAMPVEPGQRVLIPQSEIASPDLAEALTARGAIVTTVTAYRTITGTGGVDLPALLARNDVDAVIFASSSAVDGFFARLVGSGVRDQKPTSIDHRLSTIGRLTSVCIGPNTARTAHTYGLSPLIPAEQTLAGIIDALETEFAALSKGLAS